MKLFRFRLQALLTVRQRAEQKALEEYAMALTVLREASERHLAAQQEQESWRTQWQQNFSNGCTVASLVQSHACGRHLSGQLHSAQAAMEQARNVSREALRKMLGARQEREAVEKHFTRQREQFQREQARDVQKELDDLAQRRCREYARAEALNDV